MTEKTKKILEHIVDLYYPSDKALVEYEKMSEHVEDYRKAFDGYEYGEIKKAVDEFWTWKSDKIRPKLSQILAILNADKNVERKLNNDIPASYLPMSDFAGIFMEEDLRGGVCRHLYSVYAHAVKRTVTNKLAEKIGYSEYQRIQSDIDKRCQLAKQNNLYASFSDTLKEVCRERYGKDYNFDSANQLLHSNSYYTKNNLNAGKILGSHFRISNEDTFSFPEREDI
jgi:hypothetical protein